MTTGVGSCTRANAGRFDRDFGALEGGASVPLSIVVHGAHAVVRTALSINASTTGDNNPNDNIRSFSFQVTDPGDLRLSTGASITTTAAYLFTVPITLRHTGAVVAGHLKISLPAGVPA